MTLTNNKQTVDSLTQQPVALTTTPSNMTADVAPKVAEHPAKFSAPILDRMSNHLEALPARSAPYRLLDPFAGVGRIHQLGNDRIDTFGIEIEPEWAHQHPKTTVGDARNIAFPDEYFDVVATSPAFGNRMADHHEAKDGSVRHTYRHKLGRPLTDGNSGAMQWGESYRALHLEVWREVWRVLRANGVFLLNVSSHIRKGKEVDVAGWHLHAVCGLGFTHEKTYFVRTQRQRHGQNGASRMPFEMIYVFSRNQIL